MKNEIKTTLSCDDVITIIWSLDALIKTIKDSEAPQEMNALISRLLEEIEYHPSEG
jgi:hypothetical protein